MSDPKQAKTINRRTVIAGIGAGVLVAGGGAGLVMREVGTSGSTRTRPVPEPGPEVKALFGTLSTGSRLGAYTVAAIYPVKLGGIPVVMEHEGSRFQVDVLRRDDAGPKPVGETPSLALFLVNKGDGSRPTDELPGLGAMALATALASSEAQGARPPELLSLKERIAKYPRGDYGVDT